MLADVSEAGDVLCFEIYGRQAHVFSRVFGASAPPTCKIAAISEDGESGGRDVVSRGILSPFGKFQKTDEQDRNVVSISHGKYIGMMKVEFRNRPDSSVDAKNKPSATAVASEQKRLSVVFGDFSFKQWRGRVCQGKTRPGCEGH